MNDTESKNFVLIDLENVQPRNLGILFGKPFKVYVFVGANQAKVSIELAEAMQMLAGEASYIRMSASGKNALDFHIVYYLAELATKNPNSFFHIISKDTGFDPLISHLKDRKVRVHRHKDLAEIPLLRMSDTTGTEAKVEAIVENLRGRGQSRPRKIKTLANTINSLFTKKLQDTDLRELIDALMTRKFIEVNDGNVSYRLDRN